MSTGLPEKAVPFQARFDADSAVMDLVSRRPSASDADKALAAVNGALPALEEDWRERLLFNLKFEIEPYTLAQVEAALLQPDPQPDRVRDYDQLETVDSETDPRFRRGTEEGSRRAGADLRQTILDDLAGEVEWANDHCGSWDAEGITSRLERLRRKYERCQPVEEGRPELRERFFAELDERARARQLEIEPKGTPTLCLEDVHAALDALLASTQPQKARLPGQGMCSECGRTYFDQHNPGCPFATQSQPDQAPEGEEDEAQLSRTEVCDAIRETAAECLREPRTLPLAALVDRLFPGWCPPFELERSPTDVGEGGREPGPVSGLPVAIDSALGSVFGHLEHDINCGIPHPADPGSGGACSCGVDSAKQRLEDVLLDALSRPHGSGSATPRELREYAESLRRSGGGDSDADADAELVERAADQLDHHTVDRVTGDEPGVDHG